MTLNEFVAAGGEFHYAPVEGGLVLMLGGRQAEVACTTAEFLALRESGAVVRSETWGQGHFLFRGRVDVYTAVRGGGQ